MTRLLPLVLFCAFSAEAGLIAPDYVLVKCSEYAGGCPSDHVAVTRSSATLDQPDYAELWREWSGDYATNGAYVVGSAGDWVIGTVYSSVGQTSFVYHPDEGIVCCITDTPFELRSITEDGFLLGRDYLSGVPGSPAGFLSHVSVLDSMPTNLFDYQVSVRSSEADSLMFADSHFYARDSAGRIYGNGGWGWSIGDQDWRSDGGQFVLIPLSDVHAPEPASLAMTALGAVGLCGMAVRRRREKQVR